MTQVCLGRPGPKRRCSDTVGPGFGHHCEAFMVTILIRILIRIVIMIDPICAVRHSGDDFNKDSNKDSNKDCPRERCEAFW